jgi:hypothetical protein
MQKIRRKRKPPGPTKAQARDRLLPMMVYVNDEERERIRGSARLARLSVSAYLRAVGVGYRPSVVQDVAAIDRLAGINKAIGRIAQILAGRVEADVIRDIEAVQMQLIEAASRADPQ